MRRSAKGISQANLFLRSLSEEIPLGFCDITNCFLMVSQTKGINQPKKVIFFSLSEGPLTHKF